MTASPAADTDPGRRAGQQHNLAAYVPEDRREEAAGGPAVQARAVGSVLFADVSGFTQLTTRLAQ
ncbi:MAG: hypothetical protein KF813_10835, partial [Trueperaceae bacterium]|nr:hypothetical protein [Trueperaceae bacterium]